MNSFLLILVGSILLNLWTDLNVFQDLAIATAFISAGMFEE